MQAIGRLFYAVFYKYKWLLTRRTHGILILINWLIGFLAPIVPILFSNGYRLEEESRLCTITTKVFPTAMYSLVAGFFIPFGATILIYLIIFYKARQSTRRVMSFAPITVTKKQFPCVSCVPNMKRELRLMKNILILIHILGFGGMPFFILTIWNVTGGNPLGPLYLLMINGVSMASSLTMIVTFFMSKNLKEYTTTYLRKFC